MSFFFFFLFSFLLDGVDGRNRFVVLPKNPYW